MQDIKFRVISTQRLNNPILGYEWIGNGRWYHQYDDQFVSEGPMLGTYARLLFTGRVDKNDNDIYEGDSVIAMETTFTVAYSTERTAFVLQREGFPDNLLCQFEEVEILIPNIQYNA